jgi:hypothetical protein
MMKKKETRCRRETCEGVHRANECRRDTRGRDTKKEIVSPKCKRDKIFGREIESESTERHRVDCPRKFNDSETHRSIPRRREGQ